MNDPVMGERPDPEEVAQRFHETYERLAPGFGYATREASAVPWDEVPDSNRALMIATVTEVLGSLAVPGEQPALSAKHSITLASIDRGTPEWRLHCHHSADEFRCYTETGEVDSLCEGQCVLMDWWGEYGIELVDIREPIPALPIAVEADWNGDSWDLTLAIAGLRVVPEDRPAQRSGVTAEHWTEEWKPTAPAAMSARQAAVAILDELEWDTVIEECMSIFDCMDPLAYYGLRHELYEAKWSDERWFKRSKVRSHLTAWVTARMVPTSWCTNDDHHDDMIPFNDCWHGEDEDGTDRCQWEALWVLDGDPDDFLHLAMTLIRDGWTDERAGVPALDDDTRREAPPICGTEVVTREYEGMAAEIVLCQRTGGPCPWRKPDGSFAGLRRSDAESCAAAYLGGTDEA